MLGKEKEVPKIEERAIAEKSKASSPRGLRMLRRSVTKLTNARGLPISVKKKIGQAGRNERATAGRQRGMQERDGIAAYGKPTRKPTRRGHYRQVQNRQLENKRGAAENQSKNRQTNGGKKPKFRLGYQTAALDVPIGKIKLGGAEPRGTSNLEDNKR